jgi:hypothetical protein
MEENDLQGEKTANAHERQHVDAASFDDVTPASPGSLEQTGDNTFDYHLKD